MKAKIVVFLCLASTLRFPGAKAQNITATVTGTVMDASGAVVPGAKVTAHDNGTDADVRIVTTDSAGVYVASQLPVGTYKVIVHAQGFQDYVANDVILHVGDRRTLDVTLQPGQVTQSITVTAETVPVETSTSAQDTTITGHQIRELQLNNRNFEQLVTLQPGVSSLLPDVIAFGISNTDNISVNGARGSANNWTVDGSDVNDSGSNFTLLNVPSVDALDEFKLARSTYDAQYGRSGGGQVNVVTKSGSRELHGSAYEFVRNDKFNATNFLLNSAGTPKPPLRYNDFGFTVGGPIYVPGRYNTDKSKTFFFVSEEWRRTGNPSTVTATLPPPQELTGNFQGLATLNPNTAPSGCINNNVISSSCFSQNAKSYIANVYSKFQPNAAGNTFISNQTQVNNYRQDLVRLDHNVTEKIHAFGRFMQDNVPTTEPGGLFASSPLTGISATATNAPARNVVAHVVAQLSPTIVNETAFNYSWGAINSQITGIIQQATFPGLTNTLPFSDPYGRVPGVSFGAGSISGVGIPSAPYHERNIDKQLYDNLSLVRGNHSIRVGGSSQWMRKSENGPTATNGSFTFLAANGNPGFANFLLGQATSFSQASRDIIPDIHFINLEFYGQDDWKIRSNLTLNLGVRYSFFGTPHDVNGILDSFDPALFDPSKAQAIDPSTGRFVAGQGVTPATYLNGIIVGGQNSPFGDRVNPNYKHNFAPRVGFSWDPFKTGKTAIRGGYGLFYDRTLNGIWEQNQFTNPPFVSTLALTPPPPSTPPILGVSFDNPSNGVQPSSILAPRALETTGTPDFKVPYNQQWNVSVQREVLPNTLVEVAYVGSKGTHLLGDFDLNQVPAAARLANPTVHRDALRRYPGYAAIRDRAPMFNSSYHSLQISVNRRVTQGLNLGAAYTWSKDITDIPADRDTLIQNTANLRGDRGRASFNRPQILIVNYVYDLPFFRNTTGALKTALAGWEVSGISSFYSGVPLTITQSNDPFDSINSSGIGIDPTAVSPRPDLSIGDPNGPKTAGQWFNTGLFSPVTGRFGTAGRGVVLGPGRNSWDIALLKNFRITERFNFQFRSEFFNAFNHTSFLNVSTNSNATSFGRVTSVHDPRTVQFGFKLYY